jgi:hypothetical protein
MQTIKNKVPDDVDDVTHVCADEFFAIVNTRYLNLSLRYVMVVSNVIGEEKLFCWEEWNQERIGNHYEFKGVSWKERRISSLRKS